MRRTIITYLPAIRQIDLDFLNGFRDVYKLGILGKSFIQEFTPLTEEHLNPQTVKTAIESLKLFHEVFIVDINYVNEVKKGRVLPTRIIMPNTNVLKSFAQKYFEKNSLIKIEFLPTRVEIKTKKETLTVGL